MKQTSEKVVTEPRLEHTSPGPQVSAVTHHAMITFISPLNFATPPKLPPTTCLQKLIWTEVTIL